MSLPKSTFCFKNIVNQFRPHLIDGWKKMTNSNEKYEIKKILTNLSLCSIQQILRDPLLLSEQFQQIMIKKIEQQLLFDIIYSTRMSSINKIGISSSINIILHAFKNPQELTKGYFTRSFKFKETTSKETTSKETTSKETTSKETVQPQDQIIQSEQPLNKDNNNKNMLASTNQDQNHDNSDPKDKIHEPQYFLCFKQTKPKPQFNQ